MSEHTKEPWFANWHGGSLTLPCSIVTKAGYRIAKLNPTAAQEDVEAIAASIISDHNACLGIEGPEATVPELVAACKATAIYFTACGTAWATNDGILVREDGRPVANTEGLDELCDTACEAVLAVLAKTKGREQ